LDPNRFATLTRDLAGGPNRRDLMRVLAGSGLAAVFGWSYSARQVDAKSKSHHKTRGRKDKNNKNKRNENQQPPPPLPFNEFGCLDIGQPCRGENANCCSGLCEGPAPQQSQSDTSQCVAHNIGVCAVDSDSCSSESSVSCDSANHAAFCVRTTGNAAFCGDFKAGVANLCRVCAKDTDCQAEFGAGAACLDFGGLCTAICASTGRTACVPPA
jgi:hypothetical protein